MYSITKILHHFIQKLIFQYKKIARFLGGSAPQTSWTPFLEFLPSLLDSMATVFSISVSVLKQNSSPNTKKSLGGLRPPNPHRGLCPLDSCWGPVGLRQGSGGCRPQTQTSPSLEVAPHYNLPGSAPDQYTCVNYKYEPCN